ncbi:hypothetical protein TRICI_006444 [Trichomonascus ciferrii]|uniref:VPS9 domain-containing protein n=1 Tax=Trichomonascus ciferrii TaxID=44093 RepID=A0A642UH65_9ASCO|nr:hypothetical protein TRICI_006444 [Trichomonascus ciferrii]
MFHTPPPVDRERSWMVGKSEEASYGVDKDQQQAESQSQQLVPPSSGPERAHSVSTGMDRMGGEEEDEGIKVLPEKLSGLVDRFIESLKVPRYSTPLSGDDISNLYQEFYGDFQVAADKYLKEKTRMRSVSAAAVPSTQAMETYQEIAQKKRERNKRPAILNQYVELAEKRAIESVYEKLFTLSFSVESDMKTNDQIHDRINVLRQIPITLAHLDLDTKEVDVAESELFRLLGRAGKELNNMDAAKNAKEKLECLLRAHKIIVMTLSEHLKAKSSSADLILPALIYTFIYYDTPNLWLNFQFITRFRNNRFLHGEQLYCLTNFEASLRFLQSVTLHSIGITEPPQGLDTSPLDQVLELPPIGVHNQQQPPAQPQQPPSNSKSSKKFGLLHPTDIADQSFKTLGSTYRFLVGKFTNDKQESSQSRYPNTIDDARKMVGLDTPPASSAASVNTKLAPPIDRFLTCQTDDLKMADIKQLHDDYKRLVEHLKSINAFQ